MRKYDKDIDHHLISNGTFYFSENDWFDPDIVHIKFGVVIKGAEYIGAFNRQELLSRLEKCGSTQEVTDVIRGGAVARIHSGRTT